MSRGLKHDTFACDATGMKRIAISCGLLRLYPIYRVMIRQPNEIEMLAFRRRKILSFIRC